MSLSNSNQRTMNNILQTHFNSINVLAHSIQSSQEIIERFQRQNITVGRRSNNITRTLFESIFDDEMFSHRDTRTPPRESSGVNSHYNIRPTRQSPASQRGDGLDNQTSNENNIFYVSFDRFGPSLLNNNTDTHTHDISLEILLITEDNKSIINLSDSSSNNQDISQNANNYHLYEITHFDLIENPINDVCPITRERFDSTSERILMIKKCSHIFNKSALNYWLERNNTCPCCRRQII